MPRPHRLLVLAPALLAAMAAVAAPPRPPARRQLPPDYQSVRVIHDPLETAGSLDIAYASLGQVGRDLVFSVRTRGSWKPRKLGTAGRRLCLELWRDRAAPSPDARVCAGEGHRGVGVKLGNRALDARASLRDGRSLTVRLDPAELGLSPGKPFRWRFESNWPHHSDQAPDGAPIQSSLVAVHPVGCEAGDPSFVTSGPHDRRQVALTFDDGPWESTPAVLSELERLGVPATFMLIGNHIAGREALVRRELRDGDVLGDHTWDHADVSRDGAHAEREIVSTDQAIERATGFLPCLFRAPFGRTSPALIGLARRLGFDTLQWDVDPRDWSTPGTEEIVRRVLSAVHPGAIVLLHDGGGPREQTVAALAPIVTALRTRGYEFETVPELLGLRTSYAR
jgi:peptidoglycan/xylan/chitin deacetylase (PgdA/CDA1 family)